MIDTKYRVLGIFILFTLNNGFAWLMFDPVAGWLENNVKGMSVSQLEFLSSWQPLMFFIMFFPVMVMVTQPDGLRKAVRFGTLCELIGATFKIIGISTRHSVVGVILLNIGQIFSGIGSPVATGCVSSLSAAWFLPEERTRATAAAVLSNSVGNAISYICIPIMTKNFGFISVTIYETIMAIIAVTLVWLFFPQSEVLFIEENMVPSTHVDIFQREIQPLLRQLFQLLCEPSAILLLLIYSWSSGGFSAWISLFDTTYDKFFSEDFIGIMCFCGMIAYVLGGLISSYLTDLYFSRQMKYVILICITCNCIGNILFMLSEPHNDKYSLDTLGKVWIVMVTSLCGFWNGSAAPLFYELIAEITYPIDEGVSGIAVAVSENFGALIFYQIVSRFCKGDSVTIAYSFGMVLAVILATAVKQQYNRSYCANLQTSEEVIEELLELSPTIPPQNDTK